jgi:phi13 family phage major tail protein
MATIGLKDLYRAAITVDVNGNDVYGTPTRIAKAITAKLEVETTEIRLDADDDVDHLEKKFKSGTITLGVNDLPPAETAALLGKTTDAAGVVYSNENDEAPYYAIGFRAKKLKGGKYRYIWLYKTQFEEPSEEFETIGESIEVKTPEIVGTFVRRYDGEWKADVEALPSSAVASGWFTAVREKSAPNAGAAPATFDKNTAGTGYVDVVVTVQNATSISAIRNGSAVLVSGTDYTVSGLVATIKKEYMDDLVVGTTTLTITTDAGNVDVSVEVENTDA